MTTLADDPINWTDPTRPPVESATRIGPTVCVTWTRDLTGDRTPLIWHWCTRSLWQADPSRIPALCEPQWTPAGVAAQTLLSTDPLHLEPNLLWSDCCGMHGFIRDGKWTPA